MAEDPKQGWVGLPNRFPNTPSHCSGERASPENSVLASKSDYPSVKTTEELHVAAQAPTLSIKEAEGGEPDPPRVQGQPGMLSQKEL